jgi:SEC-C motif-containing protein
MQYMKNKILCPCGTQQQYQKCCGPYISGATSAPTAEALMRSRYTAYTMANIAYIEATMRGQAALNYDAKAAEDWAKTAKWKHLKVLRTFPHETDPTKAYVEFVATFAISGKLQRLAETSEFQQIESKWFYTSSI